MARTQATRAPVHSSAIVTGDGGRATSQMSFLNKTVPGCMGWLLDRGARINEETPHWRTPLHFAVDQRQPRVEVVRFLLGRGADVDHVTEYGQTAIYFAARRGAGRVVRELLKRAPRLDEKTRTEETVLHAAAANCSLRTVKMLVEAGADVYARDNRGWSVLQFAREAGQTETAQWIAENIPWGPTDIVQIERSYDL